MIINVYKKYEPYLAYTQNTDEKEKLQNYIKSEFEKNNLSISARETRQEILDIGCGNGVNALFLARLFKCHDIVVLLKIFPNFWYNLSIKKYLYAYAYAKNKIKQN